MASDFSIRQAARQIKHGGIIAYPTDTIYGLGCDPFDERAVENLNRFKQRPLDKHFIILAGNIDQIEMLTVLNEQEKKQLSDTTEPTSWIVEASSQAPAWLVDKNNMITIRICRNSIVKKLCKTLNHALISTSANPSGKKPATNNLGIRKYFGDSLDYVLANNKKLIASPSKIIRLCDNYIIRS